MAQDLNFNDLGHEIARSISFERIDLDFLETMGLPALQYPNDLASALNLNLSDLYWLACHRNVSRVSHYHQFFLQKRRGGRRRISVPKTQAREAQHWIANEILAQQSCHQAATAYQRNSSIVDHARRHSGREVVIRIDIRNFFGSIHVKAIKQVFESFGYGEGISCTLAMLVTYPPLKEVNKWYVSVGPRALPQGACTSPTLSNLVCFEMDRTFAQVAGIHGFEYSRYADDLTFSGDSAVQDAQSFVDRIVAMLPRFGFEANLKKTLIMPRGSRQVVTGLTVNNGVTISRSKLRSYRACLHQCEVYGFAHVSSELGRDALSYVRGYLAFIQMVSPEKALHYRRRHPWIDSGELDTSHTCQFTSD